MQGRKIAIVGALGVLLLAPGGVQARETMKLSLDVAELLDHCTDDEIYNDERQRVCTELIEDAQAPADVRGEALVNRGMVRLDQGEMSKAMADFEAAVAQNPVNPVAHAYRGEVFKIRGQLEQALAAYDTAISLDDNSADFFANRGEIQLRLGAADKAKADFEAALKIEQEHDVATAGLEALSKKGGRRR